MPRKDDNDEYMVSETGNWNVAARFAEEKIMKPLVKCEIYEDLAIFGYESILEELVNYDQIPKDIVRINGLRWLVRELIKICKNTKFAMKISGTKIEIQNIEDKLQKIEEIIPALYTITFSIVKKTQSVEIEREKFDKILEKVLNLKSDLNNPLNKNHLIFTDKDEFDPSAFKARIKNRMVNKG